MSERLLVEVVRAPGRGDHFTAARPDGTRASWVVPSYHAAVPHDLVHLVVEAAFGLRDAFWGRVARGADPAALNAAHHRSGWREGDAIELLQAEGLAAIHWYDPDVSAEARARDIVESCAQFGVAPPRAMNDATITEAHAVLRALRAALRAGGPNPWWAAHYDPSSPPSTFADLRGRLLSVV